MERMNQKIKNIIGILIRDSAPPQKVIAAFFDDEKSFLKAAKTVRDIKGIDAISPYPVHGLEEILRIKRSWIPWVTFIFGLLGLFAGLALTWYTSVVSWPLVIGGKPLFSLPAFIPIIFECTILFGALTSVAALFYACDLPRINPPVLDTDLTSHKFALFCPLGLHLESEIQKTFDELGSKKVIMGIF